MKSPRTHSPLTDNERMHAMKNGVTADRLVYGAYFYRRTLGLYIEYSTLTITDYERNQP